MMLVRKEADGMCFEVADIVAAVQIEKNSLAVAL